MLLYEFLYLRFKKHNNSDVLVHERIFQILDIISFPYTTKKNKILNKFRGHVEFGWVNQSSLNPNPSMELCEITHA